MVKIIYIILTSYIAFSLCGKNKEDISDTEALIENLNPILMLIIW